MPLTKIKYIISTRSLLTVILLFGVVQEHAFALELKLSLGSVWQQSNDVQIPNDNSGTRFSLTDIAGTGPWPGGRLEAIWDINEKHGVRALFAPLSYAEQGTIDSTINFAGETFNTAQAVTGEYTFNSWRLGYRYHLRSNERWDLWLGGTLKVRDAEIKLTQGTVSSLDDDLGFVPLFYAAAVYRFDGPWAISVDFDGLAGGPGRAIDLGINLAYQINEALEFGVEYRALEGGADIDQLYNFAWFNSMLLTFRYTP